MGDSKRIATYICTGCDIGESLDIEKLHEAAEEHGAESSKDHPWLCGAEGLELIKKDIEDGVQAVVIGACTPRTKTEEFIFNGTQVERANLREHVVWTHEPNDEDTQMMAEDYVRMSITKAELGKIPEPFKDEVDKTVLVVGGGITGLTSALEVAKTGYEAVLVEKADKLGGRAAEFSKLFPKRPPYEAPQPNGWAELVGEVEGHDKITVHTSAQIEKINGQPGQFDVALKVGGDTKEFRVGAIVQATGWKPYDASKLEYLGYGKSPNVITNYELEQTGFDGPVKRPSDGKPAKSIAFIQCAGSRDKDHLPYCSAVCCRVSLKQAKQVRDNNPDANVYILYKDLRAPAQYENFYKTVQQDPGIMLTKGDVLGVETIGGDRLMVDVENTLIDPHIEVEADLVVLATGMVPQSADSEQLRALTDAQGIIVKGEAGKQLDMAKETVEELGHLEGTEILNLNYRQGPDLPVLKYGWPDSHFICFPYETRRTGIYAAGCLRAPNDVDACQEDAAGAAIKAIQCVELASQGLTVHPRWEDRSYPDFALSRCTKCKRCTEECPFGTINEDSTGEPKPNPLRCRRCGICLGACPERIISFEDYSPHILSSMIKAIEVPEEWDEKPRLLALVCENDAYPALDMACQKRIQHSAFIRFLPVRCLGSVNIVWINDALSVGFDGVLLIGCQSGDDYQCHMIRGSELMDTRGTNIQEKLEQLALESERVRIEKLPISEYERIPEIVNEFAELIDEIGFNPFKGL